MKRCIVLAVLTVLAVLACKSPQRDAQEARETVASWAAAQKMTAEEWKRGAVPDAYVRSTAKVAIEELEKLDAPGRDEAIRAWRELLDRAKR
jgi:predicted lipoprotein